MKEALRLALLCPACENWSCETCFRASFLLHPRIIYAEPEKISRPIVARTDSSFSSFSVIFGSIRCIMMLCHQKVLVINNRYKYDYNTRS